MNQAAKAFCYSRTIVRQKKWQALLGVERVYGRGFLRRPLSADNALIVDDGDERSSQAKRLAQKTQLPLLRVGKGFIHATDVTGQEQESHALLIDDLGFHNDASQPSRLEHLLNELPLSPLENYATVGAAARPVSDLNNPELLQTARRCIDKIVSQQISEYNDLDDIDLGPKQRYRILLVDQLTDDITLERGAAGSETFANMLNEVLQQNPNAEIVIKLDPMAGVRGSQGHFSTKVDTAALKRVRLLTGRCNALSLLQQVDEVHVATSQVGFEALLLGKKVVCHGLPFYAGWGLTQDRQPSPRRLKTRSIEQLFAAACLLYAHYFHPLTGQKCHLEELLDFISLQRKHYQKNRGRQMCLGFPPWKRAYLKRFLYSPWGEVEFYKDEHALMRAVTAMSDADSEHCRVVVWGDARGVASRLAELTVKVSCVCVEDGFIRSVGLGKYYVPPVSLVFDECGMYYDATALSGLESLLQTKTFSDQDLLRAKSITQRMVAENITKYNVGRRGLPAEVRRASESGKKIVLVPGQVQGDVSLQYGAGQIDNDFSLLQQVRATCPDAYVIYKPHPDVVSGNAVNDAIPQAVLNSLVDLVVAEVDMGACLKQVDEVHTMTSLTGFEALIRQVKVVTYGSPFYAGWGLTQDACAFARRQRQLSLYELVAGVLFYYPSYVDYRTGCFISAEQALDNVVRHRMHCAQGRLKSGFLFRLQTKAANLLASLVYGLRFD